MLKLCTKVALATFLFALMLASEANAESRLPPCPKDRSVSWNNCHGTVIFTDGAEYVGEYRDGKPNGQGTETFPDGRKYVGEFRDSKWNGQGTDTWPDGFKHVGEFKDGKPNGQGTETFPDGRKYVGEFRADLRNGQGTYTWPDGRKYVGEMKDGKITGQGTLTFPDGFKYVGEFKDGNPILVGSSAENSSNKATTPALKLPEKTVSYIVGSVVDIVNYISHGVIVLFHNVVLLAVVVAFLYGIFRLCQIGFQQLRHLLGAPPDQNAPKDKPEDRQRQQGEQYRRHDSSSGKMSTDQALEILGLKSGATEEEIRAAYNRLMKRVHPDVGGSSVFAKQLNRARDALIE